MRRRLLTAAMVSSVLSTMLAVGACSSPSQPTRTYTLNATLAQGVHLSGPYGATMTGPNGFSCSMSPIQESVTCAPVSYPLGTSVALVVTITIPSFANEAPIYSASGCDSLTKDTCTILMNANRTVTIRAGWL
jgi:hypothetical protein